MLELARDMQKSAPAAPLVVVLSKGPRLQFRFLAGLVQEDLRAFQTSSRAIAGPIRASRTDTGW